MQFIFALLVAFTCSQAQNHVLSLDGSGDYVTLPTVIIDNNTFTIEGWAYINGGGGGLDAQNTIFEQRDYSTGDGHSAILLNAETPTLGDVTRFAVRSTGNSSDAAQGQTPQYFEWHHYAGVVTLDSVLLYIDGNRVDALINNQTGSYSSSVDHIEIGRHYHADGYEAGYFNGFMDELRIWDGSLSADDVNYAKNGQIEIVQTPLLSHWNFESNAFIDISSNGNDGSAIGDAHVVEMELYDPGQGNSLYLDGINDYASLTDEIVHSTEFTVEVWALMLGSGGGLDQQNTLFAQRDYDTETNRPAIVLTAENLPFNMESRFAIRSNQGETDAIGAPAPSYGVWHHYAGVLAADSLFLFIDGELVSSGENNQTGVFDYSIDHIEIGRHFHSINYQAGYFNGYIDDVKVWSIPRTESQIQNDMMNVYQDLEPTLVGYYNFDNGYVEDLSGLGNHGILMNGAAIVPTDFDPSACQVRGDVNGSGNTDISDVIMLVNEIVNPPATNFHEICADLSGDELIDISDIIMLVQYILED